MKVMEPTNQMGKIKVNGFIDVKIPPKGRKIGPWKAWKRQWCTIQRSSANNTVELMLGSNSNNIHSTIEVPNSAVLCRSDSRSRSYAFGIFLSDYDNKSHHAVIYLAGISETESQRWMADIRTLLRPTVLPVLGDEFFISLVDNSFSRTSGLYGTYGIISLNEAEMTIRDPSNGEVSASWKWSQIDHTFVLDPPRNSDDIGKILVVQLRFVDKDSEAGLLYLFCSEADRLQSAVCQYRLGRQHRLVTSPLPPTPPVDISPFKLNSSRRLSRSEGDLRWPLQSSLLLSHLHSRCGSRERNSQSLSSSGEDEKEKKSLGKIARRLILASANFGLLLSTPGCSEPDSLHEYQTLDCINIEDNVDNMSDYRSKYESDNDLVSEFDDLGDLRSLEYFRTVSAPGGFMSNRRVSGVSVASGIYAEIDEHPEMDNCSIEYENLSSFQTLSTPPPLPPRRTDRLSERSADFTPYVNKGVYCNNEPDNQLLTNETVTCSIKPMSDTSVLSSEQKDKPNDKNSIRELFLLSSPPPLPPKGAFNNKRSEEYVTMSHSTTIPRSKEGTTAQDNTGHSINETPEPDYLPMSQVPTKLAPKKDDTYVVMANLINNKVAVSGL